MNTGLPALLTRPTAALDEPRTSAPLEGLSALRYPLDAGVPARIPLAGDRALILALGLGQARRLLELDPAAVVIGPTAASSLDTDTDRDPDQPVARLTLVAGEAIGETCAVVPGRSCRLAVAGATLVELVVDRLVVTAGSLRSPGQYSSVIELRWRETDRASADGPVLGEGDPGIPTSLLAAWHGRRLTGRLSGEKVLP